MEKEEFDKVRNDINILRKNNHDFRTIKKKVGENKLKEFINTIYPKFDITEIEIITGIPDSTLEHWFKLLNIKPVRNHIFSKAFPGNEDSTIILTKDDITYKSVTVKITPELAYVIGFTLGDGSSQQYMIEVFNKNRKLREVLFEYLKPYGTITEEERENGLWRLRLSNGRIANLIRDNKEIRYDTIDYIFNNEELAKQFIAAFWDAEGSVLKSKDYNTFNLYLYNSNSFLLDRICNFLKSKNIKFSILNLKSRSTDYYLQGRKINPKKKIQRINVHMSSLMDWVNLIGIHLKHSKKQETVNKILDLYGGK
ncbi:MAG TPA: hypothetical protein VJJ23_03400 [Candidatus Nanoarchaeia archaeon]|nr:hypothetical protein [Candidatus Nanoarchaeia archaeon]